MNTTWDRDSLWAKACVYFERAFDESKDDPLFGLWAALGLELLARSAVSHVSPTLLAEPDRDQRHLLHALGRGSEKSPKSLSSQQIISLCELLFEDFKDVHKKTCNALVNRRNEELHSGIAAFEDYPSTQWLTGFYHACKTLSNCQGRNLRDLFGAEEADNAESLLAEERSKVEGEVREKVSAHRRVFAGKSPAEQADAKAKAETASSLLAYKGHHRVCCPACASAATVSGEPYGSEKVAHEDDEIVVRQPVSPKEFECSACSLKLSGYAQIDVAGLGGRYTRTSHYTPEDYFGLIDPNDLEAEFEYNND